MAHGYRIVGRAGTMPSDYVPSLIGIACEQQVASQQDLYYERDEFDLAAGSISSLAKTRHCAFDSLPAQRRDPILGVKTSAMSFYCPASELIEIALEIGDDALLSMIRTVLR